MENLDIGELEKAFRQQVYRCQELLECDTEDKSIVKAHLSSRSAVSLLQKYVSTGKKKADQRLQLLKSCLQHFSHSILDYTYYHECAMTNSKFADDSSLEIVCGIIHTLSLPAQLCQQSEGLLDLLGTEILECLHWRVGALLYMYCYSQHEQLEQGQQIEQAKFFECCCAGVGHLRLMLSSRAPLGEDEDYLSHDADMVKLLKLGVFSDIHMLSLMYAGDMCYWMWALLNPDPVATPTVVQPPQQQSKDRSKSNVPPDAKPAADSISDHTPSATPTTQKGDVDTPFNSTPLATPTSCPAEQVQVGGAATEEVDVRNVYEKVSNLATGLATVEALREIDNSVKEVCESVSSILAANMTSSDTSSSSGNVDRKSENLATDTSGAECSMLTTTSDSSAVPSTAYSGTPGTSVDGDVSVGNFTSSSSSAMPSSSVDSKDAVSSASEQSSTSPSSSATPGSSSDSKGGSSLAITPGTPSSRDVDKEGIMVADSASPCLAATPDTGKDLSEPVSSISAAISNSDISGMLSAQEQASFPASEDSPFNKKLHVPTPRTSSPKVELQAKTTPMTTPMERTTSMLESMSIAPSDVPKEFENEGGSVATSGPHTPPRYDLYHVMHHTCGYGAESRWKAEFDPLKQGIELLSKYIDTARGPLKGLGWDYSRAVSLMVKFRKGSVAASK